MYVYIHIYAYMYVCMYICLYVFTLGSALMQLNSYGATGSKGLSCNYHYCVFFFVDFTLAVMIVVVGSMEVVLLFHHLMLEGWSATLALLVMLGEVAADLSCRNSTFSVLKDLYPLLRFEAFVVSHQLLLAFQILLLQNELNF